MVTVGAGLGPPGVIAAVAGGRCQPQRGDTGPNGVTLVSVGATIGRPGYCGGVGGRGKPRPYGVT